ncbi:MAG: DMT family transporter [Nitrososphaerota archaeon]
MKEYSYLITAGILWGSGHPVIRYVLGHDGAVMTSLHIAFLSTLIGLTILLPAVILGRGLDRFRSMGRQGLLLASLAGCLQYGLYPILSYTALGFIPASLNAVIVGSSPILIAVFSRLFLGERLRWVGYGGVCVSFTGLAILLGDYRLYFSSWLGPFLSFSAAASAAVYAVSGRHLMKSQDVFAVTAVGAIQGLGIIGLATYVGSGFQAIADSGLLDLMLVGYWGVAVTLGNLLFYLALKRVDAVRAGAFFFISPVTAAALSIAVLGEPLSWTLVAGVAVTLLGVRMAQLGVGR